MNSDFEIERLAVGAKTVVLRVRGRLDARSAPVLASRCSDVRAEGRHLVLNLAGITFIASSGIGVLLSLVEEFNQTRSRVRLAEISAPVDSVLQLLNLEQFMSIDATESDSTGELEAA